MWRRLALFVLMAACSGDSGGPRLSVILQTDFAPGREVGVVRTRVMRGGVVAARVEHAVDPEEDYVTGALVGDSRVTTGTHDVLVELLAPDGSVVAERNTRVTVQSDYALVVVISRTCAEIECGEMGCYSGRCVDAECSPLDPGACGAAECSVNDDCGSAPACVRVLCERGECLRAPDDSFCRSGERCDLVRGCTSGGPMGCLPADCDDGNPCTDERCEGDVCVNVANDAPCDDGLFCNGDDRCAMGGCSVHEGSPCGAGGCSESSRSCTACVDASDCGDPMADPWSECEAPAACSTDGERTRIVRDPVCDGGSCGVVEREERQACVIATEGRPCGDVERGAFGDCVFSNDCASTGTRSRQVRAPVCRDGACVMETSEETEPCSRPSREGMACGATHLRCCSGGCVNTATNASHCGGCGLRCAGGLSCQSFTKDGAERGACGTCTANTQCPPGGATCWATSLGGTGRCQCQSSSHCASGQTCAEVSGDNYCAY